MNGTEKHLRIVITMLAHLKQHNHLHAPTLYEHKYYVKSSRWNLVPTKAETQACLKAMLSAAEIMQRQKPFTT